MATSAAYIDLDEGAAPATPATGKVRVYAKTDGSAYQKDDAGTETGLAGGGGGAVATDAIFDAAGDLVVGSGANTATRLALGNVGGLLGRINGVVAWISGTSFPSPAAAGDLFHRTDLSPALWRYDGTRWLSVQRYRTEVPVAAAQTTGGATVGYLPMWQSEYGVWLIDFRGVLYVATTNDGSKYWTINLRKWSDASVIATANTQSQAPSTDLIKDVAIGAVSTENVLYIDSTKTSTPGAFYPLMGVTYQLIAT
jgi:hypothetical protein